MSAEQQVSAFKQLYTEVLKNGGNVAKLPPAIAKKNMAIVEKAYEALKADIEFKVANRPLLVEQVSQAFIHNLN